MWSFHNTSFWFSYLLFSYSLITSAKFLDFSALRVRILLLKTFFDGRPIEQARQKVDFRVHEWQRGIRFSKVTPCIRRHERISEISWSLIGHKKYNATKFVLNQKQERKWALELVR